jgi:hypothetical protein
MSEEIGYPEFLAGWIGCFDIICNRSTNRKYRIPCLASNSSTLCYPRRSNAVPNFSLVL